jgi:hypothetical protein
MRPGQYHTWSRCSRGAGGAASLSDNSLTSTACVLFGQLLLFINKYLHYVHDTIERESRAARRAGAGRVPLSSQI